MPESVSIVQPIRILLASALVALACSPDLSGRQAERLVRSYNERLIEAYRSGDAQLMEGLVGDDEAKKLTGLIGAKLDMGITLDAELRTFIVLGVEAQETSLDVLTEERWHYRDRRIGSGETVGQESTDYYLLRYVLKKPDGVWVVDAVRFESPPEVGRAEAPNQAPLAAFHGIERESLAGGRSENETAGRER